MILQEAKRSMKGLLGLALGYQHARDSCVYFERVTEQWQLVRAPPWIPEVAGSTLSVTHGAISHPTWPRQATDRLNCRPSYSGSTAVVDQVAPLALLVTDPSGGLRGKRVPFFYSFN